jgi:hypothetical protein
MKYGYIRRESGRGSLRVALALPSSNSPEVTIKTPVQLTEQTDTEQVQREILWTRARINLIIL